MARAGSVALLIRCFHDADEVARGAAAEIEAAAREAVAARGCFSLALAGGDTPRRLYRRLAAERALDPARTEFFWSDERDVLPDHPDSNFRMAREELLDPLGADPKRVHRMEGESADLDHAARAYEAELVRVLGEAEGLPPRLDCVLLGMGADGHTGSLFPHTAALSEARRGVVANEVPGFGRRLTFTFPLILRARRVLVLVSGKEKAPALAEVLEGPRDAERLPAQRLRVPGGRLLWLVDADAASRLRERPAP